jgi:hypothetical protein
VPGKQTFQNATTIRRGGKVKSEGHQGPRVETGGPEATVPGQPRNTSRDLLKPLAVLPAVAALLVGLGVASLPAEGMVREVRGRFLFAACALAILLV